MSLIAVLGDVHGNIEALDAVLADIGRRNVDGIYCLGDIVGYGPNPNECVDVFRNFDIGCVAGNHDLTSVDLFDVRYVNPDAQKAFAWTNKVLTQVNKDFLYTRQTSLVAYGMFLVHGSPSNPTEEYVFAKDITEDFLGSIHEKILVTAHTHVPFVKHVGERLAVNPGSVGQPRDRNNAASYAVIDTERMEAQVTRLSYDIASVVRKIEKAGLPKALGKRLYFAN